MWVMWVSSYDFGLCGSHLKPNPSSSILTICRYDLKSFREILFLLSLNIAVYQLSFRTDEAMFRQSDILNNLKLEKMVQISQAIS